MGIIVVAVVVALGIASRWLLVFRHKGGDAAPSSMAPSAPPTRSCDRGRARSASASGCPTPPPAVAPPAPPEPKPLAAKAQVEPDDDEPAAPKPHASTHRHMTAKKAKAAKKHH